VENISYLISLPDFENGHTGDDGVGVVLSGGVYGVVGSDDKNLKTCGKNS